MAISLLAYASGEITSAPITYLSCPLDLPAGASLLVVALQYTANASPVAGVAWQGSALTKIASQVGGGATAGAGAEIWYLLNPASGNNSITVSGDGTTILTASGICAYAFSGTLPSVSAIYGATGQVYNPGTLSVAASETCQAGDWLVDSLAGVAVRNVGSAVANAGQTELIAFQSGIAGIFLGASYKPNVAAGANSMGWTEPSGSNYSAYVAIGITATITSSGASAASAGNQAAGTGIFAGSGSSEAAAACQGTGQFLSGSTVGCASSGTGILIFTGSGTDVVWSGSTGTGTEIVPGSGTGAASCGITGAGGPYTPPPAYQYPQAARFIAALLGA